MRQSLRGASITALGLALAALAIAVMAELSASVVQVVRAHAAPAAHPRPSILFTAIAGRGTDTELFRVLPNGRQLRALTDDVFGERLPAWSYDRRRIAFTRYQPRAERCHSTCSGSLWTMDADGRGMRRLTHPPEADNWFDENASWSPNGRSLVFERYNPGLGSICAIARDGSHLRRLIAGRAGDEFPGDPAWGPTGWIAFTSDREGGGIFLVRPNGKGMRKLIGNPRETVLASPVWNATGSMIAFSEPDLGKIYVASTATGEIQHELSVPRNFFTMTIAWSPDGRTLAFNGRDRIYLIGLDGRNLHSLTGATTSLPRVRKAQDPAWR
jgi:Tol biopolymer transport system component